MNLKDARKSGFFIAIDGIDGAGKTTQVHLLESWFGGLGLETVVSKEPTDGPWGRKVRESAKTGRLDKSEELESFLEDRREHIEKVIQPAVDAGKVIILDRYFYSTIAYQGARFISELDTIEKRVRENVINPDVAYIMDVEPSLGHKRILARDGKVNKFESVLQLTEVWNVFDRICQIDPAVIRINGSLSIKDISTSLKNHLLGGVIYERYCRKSYGCDDHFHCTYRMTDTCDWLKMRRSVEQDESFIPAILSKRGSVKE